MKSKWDEKRIVSMASILIFAVLSVLAYIYIGKPMIKTVKRPEDFRAFVESQGSMGELVFVAMAAVQVIVAIIPGEPLEVGAGYAFGAVKGTLLATIGILIGSVIVFTFVKVIGVKAVSAVFPKYDEEKLNVFKNEKKFNSVIFLLMLIPGTPKDILTYMAGLTPMKLGTWLLISTVARAPSIISSALAGSLLGQKNYRLAVITFVITGALSLIGIYYYKKSGRDL